MGVDSVYRTQMICGSSLNWVHISSAATDIESHIYYWVSGEGVVLHTNRHQIGSYLAVPAPKDSEF